VPNIAGPPFLLFIVLLTHEHERPTQNLKTVSEGNGLNASKAATAKQGNFMCARVLFRAALSLR